MALSDYRKEVKEFEIPLDDALNSDIIQRTFSGVYVGEKVKVLNKYGRKALSYTPFHTNCQLGMLEGFDALRTFPEAETLFKNIMEYVVYEPFIFFHVVKDDYDFVLKLLKAAGFTEEDIVYKIELDTYASRQVHFLVRVREEPFPEEDEYYDDDDEW